MATVQKSPFNFSETRQQFEQSKPGGGSGLKSFLHKRNNSEGAALPSSFSPPASTTNSTAPPPTPPKTGQINKHESNNRRPLSMACPQIQLETNTMGQWHQKGPVAMDSARPQPQSPTKAAFTTRFSKDKLDKPPRVRDTSPQKIPKSSRSATNLKGLLRPRSKQNLSAEVQKENDKGSHQKENRKPSDPANAPSTPIYAQFCRGPAGGDNTTSVPGSPFEAPADPFTNVNLLNINNSFRPSDSNGDTGPKQRPKSFQPQYASKLDPKSEQQKDTTRGRLSDDPSDGSRSSTWAKARSGSRARVLSALTNMATFKSKSNSPESRAASSETQFDPNDIDKHLEALLDRRNIPENQRYKMRNLNSTVKMEFIRQDWAEAEAMKLGRPSTNDSDDSALYGASKGSMSEKKHTRGRSFTFSRNSWKIGTSPSKGKKKDASVKGHSRNKSTDSVAIDRPTSAGSYSGSGIIAKVTGQQPSDFVTYLRKVQRPESVEVGKIHKLRLLLRNESVAWTEDFIRQGGMKEIVGLLQRIMAIEWREEHEDALLHEDLLCLKALCTTALALQYLHEIHSTLLPALIHMIFDPEKKGPSEFTTRNIITSILLTYIQSSTPQERLTRAQTVLSYLRDPEPKEDERPVEFVLEMRRERPYRVWSKEVVSVTKEVFWIFLHNLNVIALPAGCNKSNEDIRRTANADDAAPRPNERSAMTPLADDKYAYMDRHFPQERPPVPAAPYVGGVEWDATNYLASHLDLINAIIACTLTRAARNELRTQLRISGWERCMGGSLRLCKEKFYPGVHDALRTWVAAAADDGWDVRDVRFGPPQESRSSSPKKAAGGAAGGKKKPEEAPPKLDMPKLDFILDGPLSAAP